VFKNQQTKKNRQEQIYFYYEKVETKKSPRLSGAGIKFYEIKYRLM